ncbi:DNA polymerase eta [Linum perenne]
MPVARPESSHTRIIAHVDMDCFYVQVEQRKQPELRGLPAAVVQYNEWKGGGLIAVSYEARGFGVKRCVILGFHLFQFSSMRGDEAKQVCPQIQLVQVPVARGKADLSVYRNAGSEVVSILARKGRCERASIDEVYLDLTDAAESMMRENPPENLEAVHEEVLKSHVLGLQNQDGIDGKENVRRWLCNVDADHRDKLLACGAIIVAELRMQVLQETEFTCSAGIAHNKMLAKLASGMNKPAQQTVVPLPSVDGMLSSLPIKKMKQLGGKLGSSLQYELGVNTVGDLLQFSEEKLQDSYGVNTGTWLWNIARGINGEEVQERLLPKSHGSGKSFPGPRALKTIASVQHWLNQLCDELSERICCDMEENKRIAHTLTLHATTRTSSDRDSHRKFPSKSCPLRYGTVKIQEDAFNLFQAGLREFLGSFGANSQVSCHHGWAITGLSVSASKIMDIPSGTSSIMKYFGGKQTSDSPVKHVDGNFIDETAPSSSSGSKINSELECHESRVEFNGNHVDYQEEKTITMQDDKNLTLLRHDEDSSTSEASQPVPQAPSDSWSGKNINAQEFASEDARHQSSAAHSKRKEQKKNDSKDQGTILRFLKSNDPCISSEQDRFRKTGDQNAGGGRGTWNYKIDEIDESVIVELPKEIQDEVKAWIRPQKRANTVRRGATIGHYFSASQK